MKAFEVWDPPTPPGVPRMGIVMSQEWMAKGWASRMPGRTVEEIEVFDADVIAVFEDGREAEWCERVGLSPLVCACGSQPIVGDLCGDCYRELGGEG